MSIQTVDEVRVDIDALKYAQKVWEALDTPISLSCYILAKYKDFKTLVDKRISPLDYTDPLRFSLDYQAVLLLSKYPFLDTGINTTAVAYENFLKCELQCAETNERFRIRDSGYLFDSRVERILSVASRKITSILGDVPELSAMEFSFGPGAAYGVRKDTSVYKKVTAPLECTFALAHCAPLFLEEFPGWVPPGIHDIKVIPGNQLSFVPKNAKTDRPICIEPLLNGLLQKGIGSWLRRRLRSHGINLDDQTVNQRLAQHAVHENLSTVDFSSASDTIAFRTVMDLLPIDWFVFMNVARSPSFEYNGVWTDFHKFSSMGNAYTFELETLIFYSVAYACCLEVGIQPKTGVNLSVYGDDVILPSAAFDLFSEVTKVIGFTINEDKTFKEGLFFESCGCDFFDGTNVRPFLIKKRLNRVLPSYYAANSIRRLQKRLGEIITSNRCHISRITCNLDYVHAWIISCIPRGFRVMGPEGYGDGHLIAELDAAMGCTRSAVSRHRHYDAWWFTSYIEQPIKVLFRPKNGQWLDVPMSYCLYFTRDIHTIKTDGVMPLGAEPLDNGDGYAVRGYTRIRKARMLCHFTWPTLLSAE